MANIAEEKYVPRLKAKYQSVSMADPEPSLASPAALLASFAP